jgi:hypothetical protein
LEKVDWSSDEVKALFATAANPPTPSNPGEPGGVDVPDVESESTPVGAIVGGVVGGIGGAALIGVLAWMLVRRKRKTAVPTSDPDNHIPDNEAGGNGGPYSAYHNDKGAGVPETHGNGRYSELPAQDAAATYPLSGPAEADSKSSPRPPTELDSSYYGRPVELGSAGPVEMDATPTTVRR